ncbi:MAG: hypothetical protein ABIH49_00670 [archaeon]
MKLSNILAVGLAIAGVGVFGSCVTMTAQERYYQCVERVSEDMRNIREGIQFNLRRVGSSQSSAKIFNGRYGEVYARACEEEYGDFQRELKNSD